MCAPLRGIIIGRPRPRTGGSPPPWEVGRQSRGWGLKKVDIVVALWYTLNMVDGSRARFPGIADKPQLRSLTQLEI
jgi:hypothetical protein